MPLCDYCSGPITGAGHAGRPWPGRPAAGYCCFGCLSLGERRQQEANPLPDPGWKPAGLGISLGISLIVVAQSMIFGLAQNLHDDVPEAIRWIVQSLILCATLLVISLLGVPLIRTACHKLRRGRLTIEALFLLTMAGAMAASLQAFITGRGKIYFEVVSILLVVYTLGKVIGARSRSAALAGSRVWAGQLATCRRVDSHGRTRSVAVTEVLLGDLVEVDPGEMFAVDGVIRAGSGFVSEAAVSGEPFAVVRHPGDRVVAGAVSHDTAFLVEATAPGTERQVDRLLAAVEAARDRPMSLQARADALGRWFFPLVVVTALATFGYWTFLTPVGWEAGLFHAMSVLLVACPCVIGLATPIIVWSALARLAERGIMVRAGDVVERLAEVDVVMFDKTGTLTDDGLALIDIATSVKGGERAELLGWLSVVQERSNHPVARAFAKLPRPFPQENGPRVVALKTVPGCGVEAILDAASREHRLQIGRPEWIASCNRYPAGRNLDRELRGSGHRVDVALDGEHVAAAVLVERLRESAPDALAGFRSMGLPVEVLTGDLTERAGALGLPAPQGGLLPDDKHAVVEAAKAAGRKPLFVGDGINDAAALAAAHAGVALASGTDLAVSAADITLYHTDLRVLPWAVELSRGAVRLLRRNLYRAVCYNLFGMALAACGVLHPVVAVLLMTAASLSLVFSSTRVGVSPGSCANHEPGSGGGEPKPDETQVRPADTFTMRRAIWHGLAFALQGVAFLLLLESVRRIPWFLLVFAGFGLVGILLARTWSRWAMIPHSLDMCFGMLTLGNLGMLLGWWADSGFAPIHDAGCCRCVELMRTGMIASLWMWVGMLGFANVAMLWLPRRSANHGWNHTVAMFTGGNVGMLVGMIGGGWCAAQIEAASITAAVVLAFVGMTLGMLGGMLAGTWLTESLLATIRTARGRRWWRGQSPATTGRSSTAPGRNR